MNYWLILKINSKFIRHKNSRKIIAYEISISTNMTIKANRNYYTLKFSKSHDYNSRLVFEKFGESYDIMVNNKGILENMIVTKDELLNMITCAMDNYPKGDINFIGFNVKKDTDGILKINCSKSIKTISILEERIVNNKVTWGLKQEYWESRAVRNILGAFDRSSYSINERDYFLHKT